MKKIFGLLVASSLFIFSCKDDDNDTVQEIPIETQNSYDDAAALKFLSDNYFDGKGNIVAFNTTSTDDDDETPLSEYDKTVLPSGVIVIKRDDAQPVDGKTIESKDKLRIMHNTNTYLAVKGSDGVIKYESKYNFKNTIAGGYIDYQTVANDGLGLYYYYVPREKVLKKFNTDNNTTYTESFFEIEGFREGLSYFKSCEIPDSENYNLQGIIIVPSRAAFARDKHYPYVAYSLTNRSFIFNFQIYKATTRTDSED